MSLISGMQTHLIYVIRVTANRAFLVHELLCPTYPVLQEGGQALLLIPLIILCLPLCEVVAGYPFVLVLPLKGNKLSLLTVSQICQHAGYVVSLTGLLQSKHILYLQ